MTRAVLLAAVVAVSACSSGPATRSGAPPVPAPAPVVEMAMRDYHFDYDPEVPAGRVVFRVTNQGAVVHHLTMIPLPEDVPPIDEQLRGTERRLVEPFAGIYDREPGDIGTFAVDLAPDQRYAMICSVVDDDGEPHWSKGPRSSAPLRPPAV